MMSIHWIEAYYQFVYINANVNGRRKYYTTSIIILHDQCQFPSRQSNVCLSVCLSICSFCFSQALLSLCKSKKQIGTVIFNLQFSFHDKLSVPQSMQNIIIWKFKLVQSQSTVDILLFARFQCAFKVKFLELNKSRFWSCRRLSFEPYGKHSNIAKAKTTHNIMKILSIFVKR